MTSVRSSPTRVSATRLLDHATVRRSSLDRMLVPIARRTVEALLRRLGRERLTVVDLAAGRCTTYGRDGELHATIEVHDPRAYLALLREGAAGLGRGYLEGWWSTPDVQTVVRVAIRNVGGLDRFRNRMRRATFGIGDRIRTLRPRDTRRRNREDIGAHYDIGNAFFELFLDETMTYSSAIFRSPADDLADASRHKYDVLLDKLRVGPADSLLEIGTGWGGMAIRAATTIGCPVTTTTISAEQLAEAGRRVREAGVDDRVTLLGDDWRDLTGTYDRVVSIEMIEAVDWRDYGPFFAAIEERLAPDGLAAIQAICVPDERWERTKNTVDFIKRFVFPNGQLPSLGAISRAVNRSTRLRVIDTEDFGDHYAETLRRWRESFDGRLDEVRALGLDDRFCRLWHFYLAYCEAAFRERHCTVVHVVLAGRDWHDRAAGR